MAIDPIQSDPSGVAEMPFELVADYYDLLYQDKDYVGEADYVLNLLRSHGAEPTSILELGCGTGRHASAFAKHGCHVIGVDRSQAMLAVAEKRIEKGPVSDKISLERGDVRSFRSPKSFGSVVSLFHIASYQTSNDDFSDYLKTAAAHLDVGGVFLFDIWFGPAVLAIQPSLRVRRFSGSALQLTRIAEPKHHPEQCRVDVDYTIFWKRAEDKFFDCFEERHPMRYFDLTEIDDALGQFGFNFVHSESWMDARPASDQTWSVTIVARKK